MDRSIVVAGALVPLLTTAAAQADDPPKKSNAPKEAEGSGSGTNMIDEDRADPIGQAWRKGAGPNARKPQTTAPAPAEASKGGEESVHGVTPTATSQDEDGVLESYDKPKTKKGEEDGDFKAFGLIFNPLGIFIGRYSAELQYLPIPHHALVLNPHFDHVSADVTQTINGAKVTYEQGFTGFGTELGYRVYTSGKGAAGFFVGPSFLFGYYATSVTTAGGSSTGAASPSVGFTTLGGAVDLGGQAIVGPGVIIGGGFGLQYTSASQDFSNLPLTAAILVGGGLRPRFLLSVGYAF